MTDPQTFQIGDEVRVRTTTTFPRLPPGREQGEIGRVYQISPLGSIRIHWERDGQYDNWGYSPSRFLSNGGPW